MCGGIGDHVSDPAAAAGADHRPADRRHAAGVPCRAFSILEALCWSILSLRPGSTAGVVWAEDDSRPPLGNVAEINAAARKHAGGPESREVAARFFSGDVDTVEALFTSGIISMAADACRIVSILAVIAVKNTGLALILLLVLPLFALFTRHVQKRMLAAQLDHRRAVAAVSGQVPETLHNIPDDPGAGTGKLYGTPV